MMHQWIPNSARVLGVAAVSLTVGLMGCGQSETVENQRSPPEKKPPPCPRW